MNGNTDINSGIGAATAKRNYDFNKKSKKRAVDYVKEKKMLQKQTEDVGVVVGRFQVDSLHSEHKKLLDTVANSHPRLIILMGISACKCTYNNPLDFAARRSMLQEQYPDATILYINDVNGDSLWSQDLDNKIDNLTGPEQTVRLYGSRDSFIPYYHGKFPVEELIQEVYRSGTAIRKQLAANIKNSTDFRAGAIWAMQNQWPCPRITMDVAIFSNDTAKILLGRKKNEDKHRLIGGFVQNNEPFETTVMRETKEETHLLLKNLQYIGSFPIDDWRYRGERDKITTVLFTATINDGKPQPDDDIHELKWFDFTEDLLKEVVPNHVILIDALLSRTFV